MSVAQSVDVQSDKVSFQPVVEDKQGLCCPDLIHHCGARTEKRITEKSDIQGDEAAKHSEADESHGCTGL